MNDLASTMGKNARAAREKLGLTQLQVAEEIGIPSALYDQIEQGRTLPSIPLFAHMVRVLKIDSSQLLSGIPPYADQTDHKVRDDEVRRLIERIRRLNKGALRELVQVLEQLDDPDDPDES